MPDTPHHDLSATPRWYSPRGRAGRAEFWGWFFGLIPLSIAAFILLSIGWALAACYYISSGAGYMPMIAAGYTALVVGLVLLPFCLMLCRRLRDAGFRVWIAPCLWCSIVLNAGLAVDVSFAVAVNALREARPIVERIDAQKAQLQNESARLQLKEQEERELRALVQQLNDEFNADRPIELSLLSILTVTNGAALLLLLTLGFLPSKKHPTDPES